MANSISDKLKIKLKELKREQLSLLVLTLVDYFNAKGDLTYEIKEIVNELKQYLIKGQPNLERYIPIFKGEISILLGKLINLNNKIFFTKIYNGKLIETVFYGII